ncbi:MAG: DUF1684 domain-containing protein [Bacteroidales bacterium]|nr:DUF1684 domain-containing protein [Bacteroidales bacterium]
MRNLLSIVCIIAFFSFCNNSDWEKNHSDAHSQEVKQWQNQRIERLKAPDGWLTLAGLLWLEEGENSFGSAKSNDVIFPVELVIDQLGWIYVKDNQVSIKIKDGFEVLHDSIAITEMNLLSDADGKATVLNYDRYSWYIIKRNGRFAIRLKDKESKVLKEFKGIETWPIDQNWKFVADYKPYNPPKNIIIPNVMGSADTNQCFGTLEFEIEGNSFSLDPIGEKGAKNLFIILSDETSGMESYGGGRFLYVPGPDSNNKVIIDFNKAYNPPCAFTAYATCPLPPEQNHLPVLITAGEKSYGNGHH